MNKYNELVTYFGSAGKIAKALGITRAAISRWHGKVPPGRAYQLEVMTHGKFKASELCPQAERNLPTN